MYQAPRGTSDILPPEQGYWGFIKQKAAAISELYGYRRIDTPTFEVSQLFQLSIGDATDIVQKEMYSFKDKGEESLTLRPEGTAPVCRAYVEHGMHNLPQPVRLYYIASIFRYERPQAGRYREHHQFGVEALGNADPGLDAEVIDMAWQLYVNLGLTGLALNLNSIGCKNCRPHYLNELKGYYSQNAKYLCQDCKLRLALNPLRLLDCKKPSCTPLAERAPKSIDYLCNDCAEHFKQLAGFLKLLNIPFTLTHRLVRGLDYYTRTVFEIAPEGETGSQVALGGGGRYDNLIEQLGGKPTPAVGFATGIERLVLNLKKQKIAIPTLPLPTVFVAYLGKDAKEEAIRLTAHLRKSGISALASLNDRSLKAQLKQANVSGVRYTVIIGEDEVKSKAVVLRNMAEAKQETIPIDRITEALL